MSWPRQQEDGRPSTPAPATKPAPVLRHARCGDGPGRADRGGRGTGQERFEGECCDIIRHTPTSTSGYVRSYPSSLSLYHIHIYHSKYVLHYFVLNTIRSRSHHRAPKVFLSSVCLLHTVFSTCTPVLSDTASLTDDRQAGRYRPDSPIPKRKTKDLQQYNRQRIEEIRGDSRRLMLDADPALLWSPLGS